MRIYQVVERHPAEKKRLLATKYVDVAAAGWEIFHVRPAVVDWIEGQTANLGLVVVVTTLQVPPLSLSLSSLLFISL